MKKKMKNIIKKKKKLNTIYKNHAFMKAINRFNKVNMFKNNRNKRNKRRRKFLNKRKYIIMFIMNMRNHFIVKQCRNLVLVNKKISHAKLRSTYIIFLL